MNLDNVIKSHVLKVLSLSKTKKEAAEKLGICLRTLRNYLHKFGRSDLICENNRQKSESRINRKFTVTPQERDDAYNWEPR